MWSQGSRVSYNDGGSTHQVPDAAGEVGKKRESAATSATGGRDGEAVGKMMGR
jgi:hypothetical protein